MKSLFIFLIVAISTQIFAVGFDDLPREAKQLIVKNASIKSILNFCQTSTENQKYCHADNDDFWRLLIARDFSALLLDDKGSWNTWKDKYMVEHKSDIGAFVSIAGGTYTIGSPDTEVGRSINERLHQVELPNFSIMSAAVTQESYARVMGNNPSQFKEEKYCPDSFKKIMVRDVSIDMCADHPVEMVSYYDVQNYVKRMNEIDPAHTYSVPTEAQLEVAFRGGTSTAYVSGRDDELELGDYVWYRANSNKQTQPVSSKKPNLFGIYRSSVSEWTQGCCEALDPNGPVLQNLRCDLNSVYRGGSWTDVASSCRSAFRYLDFPSLSHYALGFRLVRIGKS